jgi:hypothetical protein
MSQIGDPSRNVAGPHAGKAQIGVVAGHLGMQHHSLLAVGDGASKVAQLAPADIAAVVDLGQLVCGQLLVAGDGTVVVARRAG